MTRFKSGGGIPKNQMMDLEKVGLIIVLPYACAGV